MAEGRAASLLCGGSRQWLHWIKVNMEPGDVVMSYSGPNPPQGNHR